MLEGDLEIYLEVRTTCLQIHPLLLNLVPGAKTERVFAQMNYSLGIQAEVDSIYGQMYDTTLSTDDVINTLHRLKTSENSRDHALFSCMLHSLFGKYRSLQFNYPISSRPVRGLVFTAHLFGSLIHHQLLEKIPLDIAIRYIFDSLKCSPHTNLFRFGMEALNRFEPCLVEWRPLCEGLLQIPHFTKARPDLVAKIQRILASSEKHETEADIDNPQELSNPARGTVWGLLGIILNDKAAYKALLKSERQRAQIVLDILQKASSVSPSLFGHYVERWIDIRQQRRT